MNGLENLNALVHLNLRKNNVINNCNIIMLRLMGLMKLFQI